MALTGGVTASNWDAAPGAAVALHGGTTEGSPAQYFHDAQITGVPAAAFFRPVSRLSEPADACIPALHVALVPVAAAPHDMTGDAFAACVSSARPIGTHAAIFFVACCVVPPRQISRTLPCAGGDRGDADARGAGRV